MRTIAQQQRPDDIVRDASRGKGLCREVSEIVNPQFLDASRLGDPPESLS